MCYNGFRNTDERCFMKTIPFERLYNTEFFISEPMAKTQNWRHRANVYDAFGKPKVSHTLLWFKNCRGRLTMADGETLDIERNQLTYMAKGIEYRIDFLDTNDTCEDTVVVHFQMTDREGEDILPCDRPFVCINQIRPSFAMDLDALAEEFQKNVVCIPEATSVIYKIIAAVCEKQRRNATKSRYSCIRPGIELLEGNSDLSLSEIAKRCDLSECYFRRLFLEYSGESPQSFRQRYRIEKAKQLLLSDEQLSIGEIAEMLHFSDIYHFSKTFKKLCGVSPSRFVSENVKNS